MLDQSEQSLLVTGGSGFIGQHLVSVCLNSGTVLLSLTTIPQSTADTEEGLTVIVPIFPIWTYTICLRSRASFILPPSQHLVYFERPDEGYSTDVHGANFSSLSRWRTVVDSSTPPPARRTGMQEGRTSIVQCGRSIPATHLLLSDKSPYRLQKSSVKNCSGRHTPSGKTLLLFACSMSMGRTWTQPLGAVVSSQFSSGADQQLTGSFGRRWQPVENIYVD